MTQKEIVLNLFKSKRFVTIRDIELSGINSAYSILKKVSKEIGLKWAWDFSLTTNKKFKYWWVR
jgi:hypothetical protein